MPLRTAGLGMAIFLAGCGVAVSQTAAPTQTVLACGGDADRASAQALADFEKSPRSLLDGPAFVDPASLDALSGRVQALIAAKPALTATFLDLAQRTDDARRDAIGRGLRGASDLCSADVKTERLGFQMQRDVAMSGSVPLVMAFSAAKNTGGAASADGTPALLPLDVSRLPESCSPKPAVATPAEIADFLNDPPGLLAPLDEKDAIAGAATSADVILARRVRDLAVTSTRTIPSLLALVPVASDAQKAAIGLGLAQAALFCGSEPSSASIGLAIQQAVASLKDEAVLAAFLAGTNAIETAALAGDGVSPDSATTTDSSEMASSPAVQTFPVTSNEAPPVNNGEGTAASSPATFAGGGGGGFVPDPNSFFVNNDVSPASLTP